MVTAAILTIGDEVSSGQIVNRNAAWLANELENCKIKVSTHLTVRDIEGQIVDALNYIETRVDLVFTTGGLGPTRDDLTRNAVCKWLEEETKFDEASWDRICQRFKGFGAAITENNRQQCFFPQSSQIIVNQAGSANAFYSLKKSSQTKIWCLPGPPLEIKRIWRDYITEQIAAEVLVQDIEKSTLLRWQCLGKSESALGEIVEQAIAGSTLISGYRTHIPYVEIKLWTPDIDKLKNSPYISRVENAISPWLISRDDENIVELLLLELEKYELVKVMDFSSQGYLGQKFGIISRQNHNLELSHLTVISEWDLSYEQGVVFKALELAEPEALTLAMGSLNSQGEWEVGWSYDGDIHVEVLSLPYKTAGSRAGDRFLNFQGERSIFYWLNALRSRELELSYN